MIAQAMIAMIIAGMPFICQLLPGSVSSATISAPMPAR